MLEARPSGLFSWEFDVREGGARIAGLRFGGGGDAGAIVLEADRLAIRCRGPLCRDYALFDVRGMIVAHSERRSIFSRSFEVEHARERCRVAPRSWFTSTLGVAARGQGHGTIGFARLFSRAVDADLPAAWPLPLRLFLVWLAVERLNAGAS